MPTFNKTSLSAMNDAGIGFASKGVAIAMHNESLSQAFAVKHPATVSAADVQSRNRQYWDPTYAVPNDPSAI